MTFRVAICALLFSSIATVASAQGTIAVATSDAPIYVKPGTTTPLRVASAGTVFRVIAEEDEWVQVEFRDPEYGVRTGFVSKHLIQIAEPNQKPMDLSIDPTQPAAARPGQIEQAAQQHASRLPPSSATQIPPAYKWTGIGLIIGGGATLLVGLAFDEDECYFNTDLDRDECRIARNVLIGSGAAIAGTGAALLVIGNHKRQPANALVVGWNLVGWRVRF